MCDCSRLTTAEYFNSIAVKWDSWEDLESLKVQFDNGLKRFGLRPDEHVLDVGCGTGNLTAAILRQLSQAGKIIAVDISSRMIEIAQSKVNDPRVQWICDSVEHMTTSESTFDRVICYSVWPHFVNPGIVARLFHNILKPSGKLNIWHLKPREAINKTHAGASEVISNHILVPASQTAVLLEQSGFIVEETLDDDTGYLVSARKTIS
jgi:ubiquinone/menaquinone biosynthesis C-methylase UbiE